MDRDRALERLAGMYASALRLADRGNSHADIAAELGIDDAAVAPLLRIGCDKLAHLMAQDDGVNGSVDGRRHPPHDAE